MAIREKIQGIIDGGIEEGEITKIEELRQEFGCLSPEKKVEVQHILDEAIAKAGIHAKIALQDLKNSVCEDAPSSQYSFETLSKQGELAHLKSIFESYFKSSIETNLTGLNTLEKENVKIVLWGKLLDIFSSRGSIGIFIDTMQGQVEKDIGKLQGVKKVDDLKTLYEKASSLFEKFSTDTLVGENIDNYLEGVFGKDTEKIKKYKQEHPTLPLSDISLVVSVLEKHTPQETSTQIYKNIESQAENVATSLAGKKKLGNELATTIDNLPFDMGSSVKEFIKGIVEKYPFLGFLVGIIMGPDFLKSFLSEEESEKKKSLGQLGLLLNENNSPLKGEFSEEFTKNIDPKKLEPFFNYIESQDIDVSTDDFWKSLLTGKSGNEKLQKIYTTMETEYGKNILTSKDQKEEGKSFYAKLNGIEKLMSREETKKAEVALANQAADLPPVILTPTLVVPAVIPQGATNIAPPTPAVKPLVDKNIVVAKEEALPIEKTSPDIKLITPTAMSENSEIVQTSEEIQKKYTAFRDIALKTALQNAYSAPIEVSYSGKEQELEKLGIMAPKIIDFRDGAFIIDGKSYNTKFEPFESSGYTIKELKLVGSAALSSNSVKLQYETESLGKFGLPGVQKGNFPLTKDDLQNIIFGLMRDGKYTGIIPANGEKNLPAIQYSL